MKRNLRQGQRTKQSWEVAVRTYQIMAEIYSEMGYELLELPRTSVAQRAEFVIAEMGVEVPDRT
jgi:predicted ATPase